VIWIGNFGRRWVWEIRGKLQGTFHTEVLRVHGSEAKGASNSELGRASIRPKILG
jgi:hypothetical protein